MRRTLILALVCSLALGGCASLAGDGSGAATTANELTASSKTATEPASPTIARTQTPNPTTTPVSSSPTQPPSPLSAATAMSEPETSMPLGASGSTERRAFVAHVIDGDTVKVEFAEGGTDTVQLIGVDTPEMTSDNVRPNEYEGIPDTQAARDHLYNWGKRAEQFAADELTGASIRVIFDSETDRRDSSGHLLAYIYVGDENFNRVLLDGGYARLDDTSFSLREEFESTESQARSNGTGLWGFRERTTSLHLD